MGLVAVVVMAAIGSGCSSMPGANGDARKPCTKTTPVELTVPNLPKEANVCKKKQDVIWVAEGASSMRIEFLSTKKSEEPSDPDEGDLTTKTIDCCGPYDDGTTTGYRCILYKQKHKAKGWLAYNVIYVGADGVERKIDPYLIIKP
jgi:hypothetical protein